ncbi:mucosa-associated lymphoid tissue lymphoma translocation protein 1 homolog [Plakobranchus ocellatus]|uniref:Mucosa-associated lymphoid tissue lymphoma translocation protein 1 homolog n=1 Tax=Plakobranchus ocellatus TaxID=259542 RepID=A0AAV4AZB1_9GAST|nr:mucosa-associated lymphoid tissue lymphoma translocation protein 1 homolog [Plakobranchus ocellatus]
MDSENKNLIKLDAERFIKVRDHLNISISSEHGWRAIVAHLDGEYTLLTDAGDYRCAIFQRADISSVQEADISSVRFTDSSIVTVDEAPDVEIKKHPQSTPVNLGGDALLSCEVWGDKSVRYQWFRGQTALQDGPCIKDFKKTFFFPPNKWNNIRTGSKSNKLQLYNIDKNMLGCYLCQISSGRKVIETKGAALQISEYLQHSEHNYSATDKVALLIRCADYRCNQVLSAANKDVQTLANIFKSLNFKGYTTEDCILSDSICEVLEAQDPQLLCMILDVCRKPRHVLPDLLDIRSPVRSGKTIIIHGTSYGLSAYENETHGILVSHLKNYLSKPISVETVFQRFRNALHKDPKLLKNNTKKQIPEVITNLYEPERSFADPIDYVGYTQEYTLRQQFWEESHRVPDPIIKTVNFPDFSVKMRLDFEYEFSNKLKIFTTVLDPGRAEKCSTWVESIANYVAEKSKNQVAKNEGCYHFRNYVELPNIHRVESNIVICVMVMCINPKHVAKFNVDLGRPLCSVLELWRDQTQLNQSRQPVGVEDGCESISKDELHRTSLYATNN